MKVRVFTLNSFAKTPKGGNPAGVVLSANNLTEKQMMVISKKVGFSETAFVQKSNITNFKVRFFTPSDEVNLCGHATIATYYLMWKNGLINSGIYKQETKAGILGIEISNEGTIFMDQNLPQYFEKLGKDKIATSLDISTDYLDEKLPVQIVSTGLKDIMVPIRNLGYLFAIKPDFEKVAKICKENNAIGYHTFTLETKLKSTAHCRNFAPLYGIPEESATGTSNGALSCYLFKYGRLETKKLDKLVFEQGYSMNKPSEILSKLIVSGDKINRVKIGGKAIISGELKIEV